MSTVTVKLTQKEAEVLFLMAMTAADDLETHRDRGRDVAAFDRAIRKLQDARNRTQD
jgi:hypothetical protein